MKIDPRAAFVCGCGRTHALQTDSPFDLRPLREKLKIPVAFFNDANAACMAECYTGNAPSSFNFLSLCNTVGGAVVIDDQIVPGQSGRAGEPGHLLIVPGGRRCYCGKCGHYDPYGSALLLADPANGSLFEFFRGLENGRVEYQKIFDEYLHYLAILTCNLHLWSDLPVLIGGYAAFVTAGILRSSCLKSDFSAAAGMVFGLFPAGWFLWIKVLLLIVTGILLSSLLIILHCTVIWDWKDDVVYAWMVSVMITFSDEIRTLLHWNLMWVMLAAFGVYIAVKFVLLIMKE